jgi:hypothetical protein
MLWLVLVLIGSFVTTPSDRKAKCLRWCGNRNRRDERMEVSGQDLEALPILVREAYGVCFMIHRLFETYEPLARATRFPQIVPATPHPPDIQSHPSERRNFVATEEGEESEHKDNPSDATCTRPIILLGGTTDIIGSNDDINT